MSMRKCLICYGELPDGVDDYHPACSRRLFGVDRAPAIEFDRSSLTDLAKEVIRSQTTLTGVQPKLSLDLDNRKDAPQRLTVVGLWGRYILKPQTAHYSHLPELEDLTMHLAELAKIDVVPHGLIKMADGELSYITRRIDRTNRGKKIPMEDFCQIGNRLTEHKYKGSHEQIAKLLIEHSSMPSFDILTYWEVVIFSWLVGNSDMHLKNFSLYKPKGREGYQLTPAYDLLSTKLVMPEDTEELALTLLGKKKKLYGYHFAEAMRQSDILEKVIENTFSKFHRIESTWYEIIKNSFLPVEMQEEYIALISGNLEKLTL